MMPGKNLRLYADRRPWADNIGFWLVSDHYWPEEAATDTVRLAPGLATKIEFTRMEEGFRLPDTPTFSLDTKIAQELVNRLWEMGIRPAQTQNSEAPMMERHLQDMRAIVAAKLSIELPSGATPNRR